MVRQMSRRDLSKAVVPKADLVQPQGTCVVSCALELETEARVQVAPP